MQQLEEHLPVSNRPGASGLLRPQRIQAIILDISTWIVAHSN